MAKKKKSAPVKANPVRKDAAQTTLSIGEQVTDGKLVDKPSPRCSIAGIFPRG
jgi:hypothetical protein